MRSAPNFARSPDEQHRPATRVRVDHKSGPDEVGLDPFAISGDYPSRGFDYIAAQVINLLDVGFYWGAKYGVSGLVYAPDRMGADVEHRSLAAARSGPALLWAESVSYLSELVWAAHAILCNPHLRWLTLDDTTLLVSTGAAADLPPVTVHLDNRGRIQIMEAQCDSMDPLPIQSSATRRRPSLSRMSLPGRARSICDVESQRVAQWECEITNRSFT